MDCAAGDARSLAGRAAVQPGGTGTFARRSEVFKKCRWNTGSGLVASRLHEYPPLGAVWLRTMAVEFVNSGVGSFVTQRLD